MINIADVPKIVQYAFVAAEDSASTSTGGRIC